MVQNLPPQIASGTRDTWTWSKAEKAKEVQIHNRGRKAYFHPRGSNGTAAVRGTRQLNHGKHYWEVRITQRIFGTSLMFGIGTKQARLQSAKFTNLVGEDDQSWGLSHKGLLWHDGKWRLYTKPFRENEQTTIGLLLDWYQGTLTYFKDGENLGVAFSNLNSCPDSLYPLISSTAAKTGMNLYKTVRGFYGLQDRCRDVLLNSLNLKREGHMEQLPLPTCLVSYLKDGQR